MQALKSILCLMAFLTTLFISTSATVLKNAVEVKYPRNDIEARADGFAAGNVADLHKFFAREVTVTVTVTAPATDCGPTSAPPPGTVTSTVSTVDTTTTSTVTVPPTSEVTVETTPPFMTPSIPSSSTEVPTSTALTVTSSESSITPIVPPATTTTPGVSTTSTPPSAPNSGDHVKQHIVGVIGGLALAAFAAI